MIFPYKKLRGSKRGPIVPVRLKGPLNWVLFNAFVDSGADYSVFHSSVAKVLQLPLKRGNREVVTVGDGDTMTIYLHTIPVRLANHLFEATIGFSETLGSGFNLIGRATFFEKFQVCFNDRDQRLRMTKLP